MRDSITWRYGAALVVVLAAACAAGCQPDQRLERAPLAVVLHEDGLHTRLSAVDLSSMEVVKSRRLRSASYSIDGDSSGRTVVSAQAGGVGPDADDVAGVWDVGSDHLDYVTLPYPNPSSVTVAQGVGYVLHGFQVGDSLLLSTVNLAAGNRVTTGTVSEWAQDPEEVGGEVFLPVSRSHATMPGYSVSAGSIERLDRSLVESRVLDVARGAARLCLDPLDSRNMILVGTVEDPGPGSPGKWRITRIEQATGRVLDDREIDIRYGVMSLCAVGDELVIADANGMDLGDPGRSVAVIDARSFVERRRIRVTGTPAAVAAWGSKLLVFDGIENELLVYGGSSDRPSHRLRLASRGRGTGDVVVFDAIRAEGE